MKPRHRFIAFLFLLLTGGTLLAAPETTYVPARDYLTTAEREINAAKSSVRLYLYLLNYDADEPNSQPARQIAALVYSDSDVSATERLIQLERRHGSDPVNKAVNIITAKDATNPRLSMGYLIRTIETIAAEEEK